MKLCVMENASRNISDTTIIVQENGIHDDLFFDLSVEVFGILDSNIIELIGKRRGRGEQHFENLYNLQLLSAHHYCSNYCMIYF